jgi:hypothetical protein
MGDATVVRASGWQCWRCWKVRPEVGLHPEHPLCLRCLEVVTGERHCIHELAAAAFDRAFAAAKWAGHADPAASAAATIEAGPLALPAFWPRRNSQPQPRCLES